MVAEEYYERGGGFSHRCREQRCNPGTNFVPNPAPRPSPHRCAMKLLLNSVENQGSTELLQRPRGDLKMAAAMLFPAAGGWEAGSGWVEAGGELCRGAPSFYALLRKRAALQKQGECGGAYAESIREREKERLHLKTVTLLPVPREYIYIR